MSEQIITFNTVVERDFSKLDLFTTAITRAHGKSHPEVFEVRALFETMHSKIKEAGINNPDLDTEFTKLRKITDHYTVPKDVCETYAGTYEMLSEADKAYYA